MDSLQNIVDNPGVGLLFLVPGMNETLRVKGKAEIVTDTKLLEPLTVKRRAPLSGLQITVEEAFLHCGRALLRSRLWDPEAQIERSSYPTYGQVLADQIKGADAREIDQSEEETNGSASTEASQARLAHHGKEPKRADRSTFAAASFASHVRGGECRVVAGWVFPGLPDDASS